MQRTAIELLIMGVLAIGLGIGWMAGRNAAGPGGLASVDPSLSPSVAPLEAAAADLAPPPLTAQERHDQALLDGLNRMAEGKPEEALKAFERARAALDTAQAAEEIAGARAQLERRKAEDEAAAAIRLALREGRGEEAAELADRSAERAAQHRPGGELAGLKKQAEALATVKLDAAARYKRYRDQGERHARASRLREAADAFAQALAAREDAALAARLADMRLLLERYDDALHQAELLRRDPGELEDAIAALEGARESWDTSELRERLAQYRLALARRKPRLVVLAFLEHDGAAGALTGTELARRLGPAFASRYELADGGAADVIAARLKMEPGSLDAHAAARQALARQARARFAVLGAFTRFPLLEVEARLVDLASGVVVQTAHVLARDDAGV